MWIFKKKIPAEIINQTCYKMKSTVFIVLAILILVAIIFTIYSKNSSHIEIPDNIIPHPQPKTETFPHPQPKAKTLPNHQPKAKILPTKKFYPTGSGIIKTIKKNILGVLNPKGIFIPFNKDHNGQAKACQIHKDLNSFCQCFINKK